MSNSDNKSKRRSAVNVGCLAFILGAALGFVVAFIWSNSQVHTLRSGYVLRGEHRAKSVIGDALFGAIIGGIVVSGVSLIRRKLTKLNEPSDGEDESSP